MSPVAQVVRAAEYRVALVVLVLVALEAQRSNRLSTEMQPAEPVEPVVPFSLALVLLFLAVPVAQRSSPE